MSGSPPARADMTHCPPDALVPLFGALTRAPRSHPLSVLERALGEIEVTADALGESIAIDTTAYVRTLVFKTVDVEVFVMAWLPGQRSPIHDHRGSACAVKVVSGTAIEQLYELTPGGTVVCCASPKLVKPGDVVGSFDADIHSLGNFAKNPAPLRDILVTIHAYSPPLAPTLKYVEAAALEEPSR